MSKIYNLAFALLFSTSVVWASDGNQPQPEKSSLKEAILSDPESIAEGEKYQAWFIEYAALEQAVRGNALETGGLHPLPGQKHRG
jgi:hypothetical protein